MPHDVAFTSYSTNSQSNSQHFFLSLQLESMKSTPSSSVTDSVAEDDDDDDFEIVSFDSDFQISMEEAKIPPS